MNNEYMMVSEILSRVNQNGKKIWTRKKIGEWLGEPDQELENLNNFKHGIKLYYIGRVLQAENDMRNGLKSPFKYVRPVDIKKAENRVSNAQVGSLIPSWLEDI